QDGNLLHGDLIERHAGCHNRIWTMVQSQAFLPSEGAPPTRRRGLFSQAAAMAAQLSAHRRQISAQRIISASPIASQSLAHWRHTSAQAPQITVWMSAPRSIAEALVAQMSAQLASSAMCCGAACSPPLVRQ